MWFADVGLGVAWVGVGCWLVVVVVVVVVVVAATGPLLGLSVPAVLAWPALAGSGAALVLFAAQAGLVDTIADLSVPGVLDESVLGWFVAHRTAAVTGVMTVVTTVGGTVGMTVLAGAGALVLWSTRRRVEAVVVVVAAAGAGLLVTGFKSLYDRARPPLADRLVVETDAALPSGHALGSMVVIGVLAAIAVVVGRRCIVRAIAVAMAALGVFAIGISRLYLGVHWVTDVLTGWLLGGAWLAVCVTVLVLTRNSGCAAERGEDREQHT